MAEEAVKLREQPAAAAPALAEVPARTPYVTPAASGNPWLSSSMIWVTIVAVISAIMVVSQFDKLQWVSSERLIEKAQEALRQQNWPAALGAIKKVNEGSRQQPEFQRVLADYLEETRSSPHVLVEVLERLKKSGEFRPMDQLWLCRAWLGTNHLDKARAAWDAIPAPLCEGLEATRLKVELMRQEGQLREADQLQADLNVDFADVPLVAVRLATAEINGPFPEVRQKATARLWELAWRRDQAGLEALRMLARQGGRTANEAEELLELVSRHPLARPADRQALVSLLMRLSPSSRAELLQRETERCATQEPLALAVWLAREGETQRLWQLSPELRRVEPVEWFQILARALAEAKQWEELMKLIRQQQAEAGPVSPAELLRWRAVALMQLHPHDVATPYAELQLSIRQGAVEKNDACVALAAQIAEDWHMLDLALEAGLILAHPGGPNEARMLENCRRIATLLQDSKVLADIAARLVGLQPEHVQYARQDAYLRLLRGERIETVTPGGTSDQAVVLLHAFKAWRLNDHPVATAALRQIQGTGSLTVGEKAVYAGLLAKVCGELAKAYQVAEKIRPELLLEEERSFLKAAL